MSKPHRNPAGTPTGLVKRHRCPVCWKDIEQTRHGNINLHFDALGGDVCPAASEPFSIAQPYHPAPTVTSTDRRELPPWHRRRPTLVVA